MAPLGLSISIITLGELYDGASSGGGSDESAIRLRQFLDGYKIFGPSEDTMRIFGNVRAELRRQGKLIADLDVLIASTALRHDLTLITRNVRHFGRINGLTIYTENSD